MSFAFMPLFTGDYLRDTRHLSPQKHGVYLLLLMHCWDSKGPVPIDEQEAAGVANCRSADEVESLRYVLERYFVRMDDGWYQPRLHRELQKSEAISSNRAEAGRQGGMAKAAKAKQMPSKCLANAKEFVANAKHVPVTPTPTPTPTPTAVVNSSKKKNTGTPSAFQAEAYLCAKGLDKKLVQEWLVVRMGKKLANTHTAMQAFEREAIASGLGLEKALRKCVENSWGGFKARWLEEERR